MSRRIVRLTPTARRWIIGRPRATSILIPARQGPRIPTRVHRRAARPAPTIPIRALIDARSVRTATDRAWADRDRHDGRCEKHAWRRADQAAYHQTIDRGVSGFVRVPLQFGTQRLKLRWSQRLEPGRRLCADVLSKGCEHGSGQSLARKQLMGLPGGMPPGSFTSRVWRPAFRISRTGLWRSGTAGVLVYSAHLMNLPWVSRHGACLAYAIELVLAIKASDASPDISDFKFITVSSEDGADSNGRNIIRVKRYSPALISANWVRTPLQTISSASSSHSSALFSRSEATDSASIPCVVTSIVAKLHSSHRAIGGSALNGLFDKARCHPAVLARRCDASPARLSGNDRQFLVT